MKSLNLNEVSNIISSSCTNFYAFKMFCAFHFNAFYITFLCLVLMLFIIVYFVNISGILFLIPPPFSSFVQCSLYVLIGGTYLVIVDSLWWLVFQWLFLLCEKTHCALESLVLWGTTSPSPALGLPHYISHRKMWWCLHFCCPNYHSSFHNAEDASLPQFKNKNSTE